MKRLTETLRAKYQVVARTQHGCLYQRADRAVRAEPAEYSVEPSERRPSLPVTVSVRLVSVGMRVDVVSVNVRVGVQQDLLPLAWRKRLRDPAREAGKV